MVLIHGKNHLYLKIMGKPSSTSINSKARSTSTMNSNKRSKKLQGQKKYHDKTKKKIMKLFNKIRDESASSISCNVSNESVIEVDCDSPGNGVKRKKSKQSNTRSKLRRTNSENHSIIIINDDDLQTEQSRPCTPNKKPIMHCSTPLNNANRNDILDISNVAPNNSESQNLNDKNDLTKEINRDSFITIDLTTETKNSTVENTVIDLANTSEAQDCLLVSASNTSLSLSGESDVTVLNMKSPRCSSGRKLQKLAKGIPHLGPGDKRKLLEILTQRILSGCNVPKKLKDTLRNAVGTETQATETTEDYYIKEVILGEKRRNSIGSNIYNPEKDIKKKSGLRMIVIDGSNVAMEHYRGRIFSVKGLKICIDYFLNRGHIVKAFVPRFRCKFGKSSEPRLLDELERRGLVVYTPSREIHGKMITSYDDRYIVQCAAEFDGVIVSGDNYRDLLQENPRWRFIIENRLLPFTWVNDMIMFPKDPLGRYGPNLEQFLKHPDQ